MMKVAILAGGFGTRMKEEVPKPMVKIGGKPIIWHVMMHFSHQGFRDFVVALGYKSDVIRQQLPEYCEPGWKLEMVDTGVDTMTGGRIKRLESYLKDETFILTWANVVAAIDVSKLLAFHTSHGKLATVAAVHPPERFGFLELDDDKVRAVSGRNKREDDWISSGIFVLEPKVFDYIEGDNTQWGKEPLEKLANEGQLMALRHESFWQSMDTLSEKRLLEQMWEEGKAPWKSWE
jgi:glucose-1-phosphate cytidylyltransferase